MIIKNDDRSQRDSLYVPQKMFKELSSVAKRKLLLFTSPSHFLSRCILKANNKPGIELLLIPPSFYK